MTQLVHFTLTTYTPQFVKSKMLPNTDSTTTFKTVNYVGLVPVLAEAIKEQQTQIEKITNKQHTLLQTNSDNATMEDKITKLENANRLLTEQLNALQIQLNLLQKHNEANH